MYIITVTFNPAIDESVVIENFTADTVNRVKDFTRHAGGKGINAAAFISSYGSEVTASGFLGESNQNIFTEHFRKWKIKDSFIRINGETRTGIKILDPVNSTTTDINYPGITPADNDISKLFSTITSLCSSKSLFLLAGSVPAGLSSAVYPGVVRLINSRGGKAIVDTSGEAFTKAVEESPYMIKPNIDEFEEYFCESFDSEYQIIEKSRLFFQKGIKLVIVSMGSEGALFITENKCIKAVPPETDVISTVGAGDAMAAGAAYSTVNNFTLEKTALLSTSFSLHAITHLEMGITDFDYVENIQKQIIIKYL